ncbi:MAG: sugar phosphorylase [Chloroflexi bacterium HGW-Chloroflexi-10]|nr:MAG: sugar phosphorylase [Chloroflexi bacterium HGW-Chloroflexi-10]
MTDKKSQPIQALLKAIYTEEIAQTTFIRLQARLDQFQQNTRRYFKNEDQLFDEKDVILITYGDTLNFTGQNPLNTLLSFYEAYLKDTINIIHILPFFPFSSDDGFSVSDYHAVNPQLGDWEDIHRYQQHGVRLMFDAVINHISAGSAWFQKFLQGDPRYQSYFLSIPAGSDLSLVTRPRTLPLLTPFETAAGLQYIWTTFSADQIDLNFKNPDTLLDIIDVLLDYVNHGADLIRLDAIAYLWKEIGTSCIHLPQTHAVVQLIRAVLELAAPGVLIITETNVPHGENLSYFGNGSNEAHLVYQFSLPPLTAHALLSGTASYLTQWAAGLKTLTDETTFFNFSASHDGVGIRPALDLLPAEEVELLLKTTLQHGGRISSKTNSDGSTGPYELNINYFDLLNDPAGEEDLAVQVERFLVSQAIVMCMAGIPGVYMHSLLGSRNDSEGVEKSGQARSINREKLDVDQVQAELQNPDSLRARVFRGYQHLLQCRCKQPAFHPNADQQVLDLHEAIFAVLRTAQSGSQRILALHNVSATSVSFMLNTDELPGLENKPMTDLLEGRDISIPVCAPVTMQPYQILWLEAG